MEWNGGPDNEYALPAITSQTRTQLVPMLTWPWGSKVPPGRCQPFEILQLHPI